VAAAQPVRQGEGVLEGDVEEGGGGGAVAACHAWRRGAETPRSALGGTGKGM
jgi:hypothetical protein